MLVADWVDRVVLNCWLAAELSVGDWCANLAQLMGNAWAGEHPREALSAGLRRSQGRALTASVARFRIPPGNRPR